MRHLNIKPGFIIASLGILGFVFFLSLNSLTLAEKIPTTIICLGLLIIGIIIETPFFKQFTEGFHEEEDFN